MDGASCSMEPYDGGVWVWREWRGGRGGLARLIGLKTTAPTAAAISAGQVVRERRYAAVRDVQAV